MIIFQNTEIPFLCYNKANLDDTFISAVGDNVAISLFHTVLLLTKWFAFPSAVSVFCQRMVRSIPVMSASA